MTAWLVLPFGNFGAFFFLVPFPIFIPLYYLGHLLHFLWAKRLGLILKILKIPSTFNQVRWISVYHRFCKPWSAKFAVARFVFDFPNWCTVANNYNWWLQYRSVLLLVNWPGHSHRSKKNENWEKALPKATSTSNTRQALLFFKASVFNRTKKIWK